MASLAKEYPHQLSEESGIPSGVFMESEIFQKASKSENGQKYAKIWVRLWGAASKQELKHMSHPIFEESFPKTTTVSNLQNVEIFFLSG